MTSRALNHQDYSLGWVCALTKELVAATVMLDQRHPDLPIPANDQNTYTLGSIGDHNVVTACLPKGDLGNNPAATVAACMTSTFTSIKFWPMVGIGGGVPPKVRLGDIVVSAPVYDSPGVVQWDLGIAQEGNNFRRIGALNKAPDALRTAITKLEAQHEIYGFDAGILAILEDVQSKQPSLAARYLRSENLQDILFRAGYEHASKEYQQADEEQKVNKDGDDDNNEEEEEEDGASNCRYCDRTKVVKRKPRKTKIKVHYGLVASGNSVIKTARERDEINQQRLEGLALCFEMEAAGIVNSWVDYSDSHKNYTWQEYAAIVAAAFAKELLGVVTPNQVILMPLAAEALVSEVKDG
ncbi:hypothetical protein MMC25_005174 [Agyrium rufum]|nr:hypothetical protein [Agyrium rufum]